MHINIQELLILMKKKPFEKYSHDHGLILGQIVHGEV